MKELFKSYGYDFSDEINEDFEKYYDILIEYNSRFNITAITEKKDVFVKHFIDSLSGKDLIFGDNILDIGSGGGFPALPLKIIYPKKRFTLIEATGKKCVFLKAVTDLLKLNSVTVVNARAEELSKNENFREKFDTVTARAVARLNVLTELCLPFVKIGGKFIAYKGNSEEEIKEAENAVKVLGGRINTVKEFTLNDEKRSIIEIVKEKNTPDLFPRTNAKIKKNPL